MMPLVVAGNNVLNTPHKGSMLDAPTRPSHVEQFPDIFNLLFTEFIGRIFLQDQFQLFKINLAVLVDIGFLQVVPYSLQDGVLIVGNVEIVLRLVVVP